MTYSSIFLYIHAITYAYYSNRQWNPKWYKLHVLGKPITDISFDRNNYRYWLVLVSIVLSYEFMCSIRSLGDLDTSFDLTLH